MSPANASVEFVDLVAQGPVEIEVRNDGNVFWVHFGSQTVVRVCQISDLTIKDHRPELEAMRSALRTIGDMHCEVYPDSSCLAKGAEYPCMVCIANKALGRR